jgi:peptidoglycan/xylan/chitin deacetylase (PgdA/CDA1 family)
VPLSRIVRAVRENDPSDLPDYALAITFDDGHKGNARLLPLFREFNLRPAIFLTAGVVNTNHRFWWKAGHPNVARLKTLPYDEMLKSLRDKTGYDPERLYPERQSLDLPELQEMLPHVEFGSHGSLHAILPNCSIQACRAEIADSKRSLESLLGVPIAHFAYPNGDYTQRDIALVKSAGYASARTVDPGWNRPAPPSKKAAGLRAQDRPPGPGSPRRGLALVAGSGSFFAKRKQVPDPLSDSSFCLLPSAFLLKAFVVADSASLNLLSVQALGLFAFVRARLARI